MTKEQAATLHRKWEQSPEDRTFPAFMKLVLPTIACNNAVTVPWCGMWLCIETDGYCHT